MSDGKQVGRVRALALAQQVRSFRHTATPMVVSIGVAVQVVMALIGLPAPSGILAAPATDTGPAKSGQQKMIGTHQPTSNQQLTIGAHPPTPNQPTTDTNQPTIDTHQPTPKQRGGGTGQARSWKQRGGTSPATSGKRRRSTGAS